MNKFIRNAIVSLVLALSLFFPMTIMTQTAYANNTISNSDITAIDNNVSAQVSGGVVSLTGVEGNTTQVFTAFLGFIKLLSSVGALIMLMFFVINFIKLGASGTNANARAQAISGLVWSGVATVCLSMSLIIFLFFFNMDSIINTTDNKDTINNNNNNNNNGSSNI